MRTLLDILTIWILASLFLGCLWALIGYRSKGAPKQEFDWPGHSFRVIDLHPDDFDRLLTPEERARRVM